MIVISPTSSNSLESVVIQGKDVRSVAGKEDKGPNEATIKPLDPTRKPVDKANKPSSYGTYRPEDPNSKEKMTRSQLMGKPSAEEAHPDAGNGSDPTTKQTESDTKTDRLAALKEEGLCGATNRNCLVMWGVAELIFGCCALGTSFLTHYEVVIALGAVGGILSIIVGCLVVTGACMNHINLLKGTFFFTIVVVIYFLGRCIAILCVIHVATTAREEDKLHVTGFVAADTVCVLVGLFLLSVLLRRSTRKI